MNAAREASAIRVTPQGDEWHGDGRVHSAVPVPFITRSSDQSAQSGFPSFAGTIPLEFGIVPMR